MKVCTKCGKFCETKQLKRSTCVFFDLENLKCLNFRNNGCSCRDYNHIYTDEVSTCCSYEVQEADKEALTYLIIPEKLSLILNDKEAIKEVERLTIETIKKDFEYLIKNPDKLKLLLEDHLEATGAIEFINNFKEV